MLDELLSGLPIAALIFLAVYGTFLNWRNYERERTEKNILRAENDRLLKRTAELEYELQHEKMERAQERMQYLSEIDAWKKLAPKPPGWA